MPDEPKTNEEIASKWARKLGERIIGAVDEDTKTLWSEDMARVAIANAIDDALNRVETCVCEDTGRQAVQGECPVHHGDACMYDVSQMRKYVNGNTYLQMDVENLTKALEFYADNKFLVDSDEHNGATARASLRRLRESQRDRTLT